MQNTLDYLGLLTLLLLVPDNVLLAVEPLTPTRLDVVPLVTVLLPVAEGAPLARALPAPIPPLLIELELLFASTTTALLLLAVALTTGADFL